MKNIFKKPFRFPNYQPTILEIFDRFTDRNQITLKGNEGTIYPEETEIMKKALPPEKEEQI